MAKVYVVLASSLTIIMKWTQCDLQLVTPRPDDYRILSFLSHHATNITHGLNLLSKDSIRRNEPSGAYEGLRSFKFSMLIVLENLDQCHTIERSILGRK